MIFEIVIPFFTEGMEDTLVAYRDFQTKDGYADQFLEVIDRIISVGGYPIDMVIDVRTSVGLSRLDSRDRGFRRNAEIGAGDSVTVRMKTVVFI